MLGTKKGELAVKRPEFKKIEAEITGGIARISARIELIEVDLVMAYEISDVQLWPGDKILLRGDAGLEKWAKTEFLLMDGTSFVLCPETSVVGYRSKTLDVRRAMEMPS